jgi:hypothetical protein
MKEKRRITSDGYFEVSKDGGNTWTKTRMKPTANEISEYNALKPERMQPRSVALPNMTSPAINESLEPKLSKNMDRISEIGTIARKRKQETEDADRARNDSSNIENILASAQAGYGLQQLLKDKRPIGQIDPAFSKLTDEAIDASRYGFTPQQRAALNQDIVNNRIAQQQRINQLAGGSASVGLTNVRAALNEELMNKYKLAAQDEQMRMQKLQGAAGLAGTRAQMGRQLFADKMSEFMQNQQAGSELLGAGIQNLVGAQRYKREKMAQDQINKMMYGNTNLG